MRPSVAFASHNTDGQLAVSNKSRPPMDPFMLLRGSICGSSVVDGSALRISQLPGQTVRGCGNLGPSSFYNGVQACETRTVRCKMQFLSCISTMSNLLYPSKCVSLPLFLSHDAKVRRSRRWAQLFLLGVGEWVIFRSEINVFVGFGQLRKLSDGACEKWILDRGSIVLR